MRPALLLVCLALAAGCGEDERAPAPPADPPPVADPRTDIPLGTALTWSVFEESPGVQAIVAAAFDSVTTENDLKWERVEPERGEYAFEDADALVGWAVERDKLVRGHTLVWHQQTPAWLGAQDWTAAELERVVAEHVRTVVGRYRGRVGTWDVVNEPFTAEGRWRSAEGFPLLDVLGPRYVEIALRAAREADPEARLMVNEIAAEMGGPKLDALVALARDLRERGVPLDGIGLEAHLTVADPPSRARLARTIRRLADLGLVVELTELDVAAPGGDLQRQAEVYAGVGAACLAVPACRRVTVWGVTDSQSWLGADLQPLPFDAQLEPKPAWDALTRALRR